MKKTPEIHPPRVRNMREVYLEALGELAKPFPAIHIPEWKRFTELVGGFRMKEFTILCGATGTGKTTLLANMSAQLLKQGVKHFVASVETGHVDFMKRVISVLHGEDINTGEPIHADELSRIHMANAKHLERDSIEFSLYEDRCPVEQIISDIRVMVQRGCKIVFIDNLNFLLEVTRSADQVIEMDRVIHSLIMLCKEIEVHIVMVMHPKKTDHGRVESEFDIKGSSTAVQEAQNVFLFNRPKPEEIKNGTYLKSDRELKIQKMRRRGMHVGKAIMFSNIGTQYRESWVVE